MRPQWSSEREQNVDPAVEDAYRLLMGAVDDLETACIRMENFDVQAYLDEPTEVTAEFMQILTGVPGASPELVEYAARVTEGQCRWADIEELLRPLPPDVAEIKSSDRFIWKWGQEAAAPEPTFQLRPQPVPQQPVPPAQPDPHPTAVPHTELNEQQRRDAELRAAIARSRAARQANAVVAPSDEEEGDPYYRRKSWLE